MTAAGSGARRRELGYLALLLVLLGVYALPIALQEAGRTAAVATLLVEDGLYEWVGALACLAAGLLFLHAWCSSAARRNTWLLLLGLFMLGLCGEEVSWGQRLFGFQTPTWFAEHNLQQELTIHNLDVLGRTNNAWTTYGTDLLQMYLLALPLLLAAFPTLGRFVRRSGLPVPALAVAFITGVLKYLNRVADRGYGPAAASSDWFGVWEIFETSLELLLLAVAIDCWFTAKAAPLASKRAGERVPAGPGGG